MNVSAYTKKRGSLYLIKLIEKLLHNHDISLIRVLTLVSLITAALSISVAPGLDKSSIDSALYVLNRLPFTYWMGVSALLSAFLLCFSKKSCLRSHIVVLVMVSVIYVELPRLMYENGFQIEYFHQAQIFHVLNYGGVSDPKYPYPPASVAHAIFSAIFIKVTGLQVEYAVSHVLPILLRLALAIMMLSMATYFKSLRYGLYLLIIAPLYVLISDTEPSFANHYIFVLPLYATFTYLMIKSDYEQQPQSYVFLSLIASAIVFSHIYFATLITISLFAHFFFNKLAERTGNLEIPYTLTPIVIFLLWHGYISEWSIQAFYKELNYVLLPAIDRFLAFEVNPLIYFFKAEERYGSILIKSDYRSLLMLKNIIVLAINIIVLGIITHALFHVFREGGFKKTALNLLTRSITYLWGFSILFLTIFGLTGTAHPQRVLEAFIIPNCCLALLLLRSLEKDLKFFKRWEAKKRVAPITIVILALTLIIVFFMPFKIIAYWGTSLTYIGFSQKSIHEAEFLSKYGSSELDIHYIGPTPYWFLTEIVNKWAYASTYSLNGQEGEHYFTGTIENMKYSLSVKRPHYVYFSSSSLFAMRAKYAIEPLLNNFIKDYVDLMNKANAVYMNSLTESIVYVP